MHECFITLAGATVDKSSEKHPTTGEGKTGSNQIGDCVRQRKDFFEDLLNLITMFPTKEGRSKNMAAGHKIC